MSDSYIIKSHISNIKQRCDTVTLSYIESLEEQLQAKQQAHADLVEKLKTIEWVEFDSKYYCPICKRPKTDCVSHITKTFYKGGHSQECWLNKAIKAV